MFIIGSDMTGSRCGAAGAAGATAGGEGLRNWAVGQAQDNSTRNVGGKRLAVGHRLDTGHRQPHNYELN